MTIEEAGGAKPAYTPPNQDALTAFMVIFMCIMLSFADIALVHWTAASAGWLWFIALFVIVIFICFASMADG